jgi:hypothetical protein
MFRTKRFYLLPISGALLLAAGDASWRIKPVSQWNEEDAKEVLTDSPWVKRATAAIVPDRGEAQRREGGKMGGYQGAGLDRPGTEFSKHGVLTVRWASALPIQTAELKAHDSDAPDWDGDYYVIAVYDVPGLFSANQKTLAADLRSTAVLKRDGKKDIKPSRVDVVLSADKLARVVYLFPRSVPIRAADKRITFVAQIGRLSLAPYFYTEEMQLQGKLEL